MVIDVMRTTAYVQPIGRRRRSRMCVMMMIMMVVASRTRSYSRQRGGSSDRLVVVDVAAILRNRRLMVESFGVLARSCKFKIHFEDNDGRLTGFGFSRQQE